MTEYKLAILSELRAALMEERQDNDLKSIDPDTLTRANDRLRKIENLILSRVGKDPEQLAEEHEAIRETIEDLQQRRLEKIMMLAKYPITAVPLAKMQPQEAKLYQDVRTAITVYWGDGR
jgi:DNA replication initiation complex subunit (GINS family)